ncbi:MAG: hypothetical protein H0W78_19690 [Planctomycetes bacterium]|nr:hypothetical protein [Planctomycetota bacterium]
MPVDLPSLLLSLPDGDDPTLWAWVESEYRRLYVGTGYRGNRSTHDGQAVSFFFDRAEHAFRQSTDYQRHPTQKTEIARERIARMAWIEPMISGQVEDSACWEVPSPTGRKRPPNRIYIAWGHEYCVWLEPLGCDTKWRFSTAYPCLRQQLRGYCRSGRVVWDWRKGKTPSAAARGPSKNVP